MNIDILLPFKEIFSKNYASAVSITIKNTIDKSIYLNNIRIFGQKTSDPFFQKNFIGLDNNWVLHGGHNKSLAYHYYKKYSKESNSKKIIEIHNRPYIFNYLRKKINNYPICIHFHNDPQTMKGSKTINERIYLAESAQAIYFVSHFIKNKFLEGLNKKYNNLHVLYNSIQRNHKSIPNKKNEIIFVGRLVPEKGAHIFSKSISKIAKEFINWDFKLIGASKAGQKQPKTSYEKNVIKEFENIGPNTHYLGFLNYDQVQQNISNASLLVIPSIWDEPLCLVAIEGLSHATTIISSDNGGLPEVMENNGIVIKNLNANNLAEKIKELLLNNNLISHYQKKAWNNYRFNATDITKKHDLIRSKILENYFFSNK